jgi:hypothetical protein
MKSSTKTLLRDSLLAGGSLVACLIVLFGWYRYQYPYGPKSCTLQCMSGGLLQFAFEHDGWFPRSDNGPEDALARLYPTYCLSWELAGISGDAIATESMLERNGTLDASSTSWIYMQGLKKSDHPDLAILWDSKAGLLANGRRDGSGGRSVLLISGAITNVNGSDWAGFMKGQEELRKAMQKH